MGTDETKFNLAGFDLKQSVSIDRDSIAEDFVIPEQGMRIVFVNTVNHSGISSKFDFEGYLSQAVHGEVSAETHDEFLHFIYEPFKKFGCIKNGFWWGSDSEDRPKNLIESYSNIFTECFGDKGRNIVTSPNSVREIVERIHVSGKPYLEYYDMAEINKMNYLEIVCEIVENMSRGEIAKSFINTDREQLIVTFRPPGKDYVNVYLPVSVVTETAVRHMKIG